MFPTEPVPEKLGAYKVIRRLSRTGAADVYLGRMEGPMGFQRLCALKLVPNSIEGDARLAEELAREAAICARLNHSAVVRMFDFFEHERRLVLVLEYVDGAGLDRLVQHLARRRQKLPDGAIWYLGRQLAGALAHAHAAKDEAGHATPVLHRNLSPESVLISWDGQVRLSGFGLGKIVGRTPDTVVGVVKGTPGYMPPEQGRGERLTARADVYAFGVLLWSLLTGKEPPARDVRPEPLSTLRQDLPRELVAAIEASMEPVHDKRKITCAEIEQWLGKVTKADTGKSELREKVLLLRSTRGDSGGHENPRPLHSGVEPRRRISLRAVRAAQRPARPLSVPAPRRSTKPPPGLSRSVRPPQATLLGGLAAPRVATFLPPYASHEPPGLRPVQAPTAADAETPGASALALAPPPSPPSIVAPAASAWLAPPAVAQAWPSAPPGGAAAPAIVDPRVYAENSEIARPAARPASLSTLQSVAIVGTIAAVVVLTGAWLLGRNANDRAELATAGPASTAPGSASVALAPSAPSSAAVVVAKLAPPASTGSPSVPPPVERTASAESDIPAGRGVLIVNSPDVARVYVTGKYLGNTNEPITTGCGRFFVRIGVMAFPADRVPTWIAPGESIAIPCQQVTTVRMYAQ
jgi:serine/threonine-protein kinase